MHFMTEPADQPSLDDTAKKPAPKRTTKTKTAKAPATKAKAPDTKAKKAAAPKKPVAKKAAKSAKAAPAEAETQPELPINAAPVQPAPPVPVAPAPPAAASAASEEWSPSAKAAPAPAAPPAPVAPAPAPSPVMPAVRARPVYIPRDVAKQLESMGLPTDGPEAAAHMQKLRGEALAAQPQTSSHSHPPRRFERESRDSGRDHGRDQARERAEQAREQAREHEAALEIHHDENEPPPQGEDLGTSEGIVEVSGKGFGFLRDAKRGFNQNPNDVFITPEVCRSYNLRDGQWIKGECRRGNRGPQLYRMLSINGEAPEKARLLPAFEELTVVSPMERVILETVPDRYTTRVIDMMAPIGKGQRGLIVAPPRTGKTTLLHHIAEAVQKNHPDIHLMLLLVDERPEEVTEFKHSMPKAEIMASSNDMDVKSHTRIAQLAIERAKRLVEQGRDVFILLDSITRVGRAFNNATAGGGRTMSGGVDSRALEIPRRIFAAARNTEEAGSLTIIATALIDTGSRMDDLIFQEFKGTGNMELALDRKISDQRIYPAVDIYQSGTRKEELLIPADSLHKIGVLRRGLSGGKPIDAIERLLFFMKKFGSNEEMLRNIPG